MLEGVISMNRFFLAGLALVFVIGLQAQPAHAQDNSWNNFWAWITHGQDPRLTVVGIGVGAAATGASYAMVKKHGNPPVRHVSYGTAFGVTTFGCMVVYPMVATVVLNLNVAFLDRDVGRAIFAHCSQLDQMSLWREVTHGVQHIQCTHDVVDLGEDRMLAINHRVRCGSLLVHTLTPRAVNSA